MADARKGFTMVELLLSLAILVGLTAVIFGLLAAAQQSFNVADTGIQLRGTFRNLSQKMTWELSHTGYNGAGVAQFTIFNGTGTNGTDVVRFSVPVACDTSTNFLDASGDPLHWGAYLTWGCDSVACADANGVCSSVEYKHIQYSMNASAEVVRSVLSPSLGVVATQVLARNITNLDFAMNGTNGITFTVAGQMKSLTGQMITDGVSQTVQFMNM